MTRPHAPTAGDDNGERCPRSERVDGPLHSFRFDGDDPYVICVYCGERRDALTGRTITPAASPARTGDAEAAAAEVLAAHEWRWAIRDSVTGDGVRIACTAPGCDWSKVSGIDLRTCIYCRRRGERTMSEQTPTAGIDAGPEYVVTLSGGEGSWAAGRHLIDVMGVSPDRIKLLFTDTNGEDADLYRFLRESAADLGSELVWIDNDGRTIWDVFRKARMIGNTRLSVCSRALKQEPARKWLEANTDPATTTVVVGIDWTEAQRLPAIARNYQPWKAIAPLTDPNSWSKERIVKELAARGIERARLYAQGFPHNNCGGACVRAGQAQWELLLRTNPERYAAEEAQEEALRAELGKDVAILRDRRGGTTKPLPLRLFRTRLEAQPDLFDADDFGGCGCMSLPMEDAQTTVTPPSPPAADTTEGSGR